MMKFMKRALSLLISAMLLACFALAEETPLLPIAIVSYDLTDEATTAALSALIEPKENALTRWERVVLSDGREAWVICQFDQTTMSNAWSRVIDAETQEVLQEDTTDTGFFAIMGSSEQNGTWQVFFVKGNDVVSTVNLDARDATILLVEPDEEGNG